MVAALNCWDRSGGGRVLLKQYFLKQYFRYACYKFKCLYFLVGLHCFEFNWCIQIVDHMGDTSTYFLRTQYPNRETTKIPHSIPDRNMTASFDPSSCSENITIKYVYYLNSKMSQCEPCFFIFILFYFFFGGGGVSKRSILSLPRIYPPCTPCYYIA